jgi:type II restriction/modification system DNA methylase subunit YeeA
MNTSALKSFAPAVRSQLMEAVGRKLDYVLTADTPDLRQAAAQVASLRRESGKNRAALIERVAYTWFNRLAALRFLDAQGWHPFKARVLTPATPDETQPEILKLLRTGSLPAELNPHTDLQRLNDLLDGRLPTAIAGADPQGEAYRGLILAACRFYHTLLPDVFDKLNDESELLLPDDLLTATSVAEGFRTEISDADCLETDASGKSRANVEILGWLYQFYISEKKDSVMARKSAVPTEDIPAVTQLFTPHWIVRYLVENSLGRLWLLNRPNSRLRDHMPYYIEGEAETDFLKITKPEEIRLVDPAVGSGHMLTYAFDLLTLIYEEEGYTPSEIPALILRHNLHGLEICPRAAQLAELALVFKAREKSRRFFQPEHLVRPRIIELRDILYVENELSDYIRALKLGNIFQHTILTLLHQFEEAKNFGSLIQPCETEAAILEVRRIVLDRWSEMTDQSPSLFLRETHLKVLRVLEQAESLTQRYHVVVANPPYFGPKQMNEALREFAKEKLPDSKADLYAMFMERSFILALPRGYVAMVVMQSWMFLHSFEKLRSKLLRERTILSMAHLGPRAFATISGEIVTVTAWCCSNARFADYRATFCRLVDGNESEKESNFLAGRGRYPNVSQDSFSDIPGSPIAYWIDDQLRSAFRGSSLADSTISDGQNKTADNGRFVREHWEVSVESVGRGKKWLPYAKGGPFRRWSGNLESVVDWSEKARQHYRKSAACRIVPEYLWYKLGITWSRVGTGLQGFRLLPQDSTFDMVGSSVFLKSDADVVFLLGLLNTPVTQNILELLNPSIDLQVKDVRNVPVPPNIARHQVEKLVTELLGISENDWDASENSQNFRDQPLLRPGLKGATLEASWRNWEAQSTAAIRRMQELETENNRLFIAAYGLDGELEPAVPEEQITLARAEARRDMAAFLSYAVGCMMGRYSPDHPGLILANAGDTLENFRSNIKESGLSMEDLSFTPDDDAIIPVLDGEWFEDDIVARTRDFLRATFGEATLKQNLRFIEDSLGKSLDKYFLTDFYKDHLQTYKKRPIYWLFQSPKKGFSALVYVHRYTKDTVNTLLNKYLRDYLKKLESRINHLVHVEATATATKEKNAARKEAEKLRKDLKDCQDWERNFILPLAQQRLEIDLDDGVKVNYLKFEGAVQPIPGLAAKED